jgi:hypothetical protein
VRKLRSDRIGICKLTGREGKFVKSHIIPKALSRPAFAGGRLIQGGDGSTATIRRDSWYDWNLVTAEGEEILRDLDTWAIEELRKQKLVWSGWGPDGEIGRLITHQFSETHGLRIIEFSDNFRLRRFFHSLLWRAAASSLSEMSWVNLSKDDLERLRSAITDDTPFPNHFFPVELNQLSTIGEIHNHTPILKTKNRPILEGPEQKEIQYARFYFDGLIAHIRISETPEEVERMGLLFLGNEKQNGVATIAYEASLQKDLVEFLKARTVMPEPRR